MYVSLKQLFKAPAAFRKDYSEIGKGKTLFESLSDLNICVERTPEYYWTGFAKSCARKIQNASNLFTWIQSFINVSTTCSESENPERNVSYKRSEVLKSKRQKSTNKNEREVTTKRSLFRNPSTEPQAESDDAKQNRSTADMPLAAINIEQLANTSKTSTKVTVTIVSPNGRVHQANQYHEITKMLIVNLTQKKMENTSKHNVQTPMLKSAELIGQLKNSDEFKKYCGDISESETKQPC